MAKEEKKTTVLPLAKEEKKTAALNPAIKEEKKPSPAMIFQNLEYGDAPESPSGFYKWLDKHNRKFGHFINNKWVTPENRKYRKSICPATKETLAETIEGTVDDVNVAVSAAKTAYTSWSKLAPFERAKYMYSVARHVQKHARLLQVCESLDNGKPFRETKNADIPLVIRHWYNHAGWAQLVDTEMSGWESLGVIGCIVPWNFPLMIMCWKVCPALAMGNTVVVKPASVTRMSALLFAEIAAEAGLPPGVFNVITGDGRFGSSLADSPDIDKIAFTGSTPIGAVLRQRIAGSGKKISLELGGKSPIIVFDSADLDSAVEGVVDAIWFNQGQVCCAGSRLLVQENIEKVFLDKLKERMNKLRLGHSLEKNIDMGPLVDEAQYNTVAGFIERAKKRDGLEVFQSQIPIPSKGYFYPPTLILNCEPTHECVREEIFGPVICHQTFRTPQEAIDLANNTKFGLGGSVWSENISLATEIAVSIKAGAIWINSHNIFDAAAGFGGYRESGFGRDGGKEGLYDFAKPSYLPKVRPTSLTFPTMKSVWPSYVPNGLDLPENNAQKPITQSGGLIIDRTPKMYIGGKQARPDWQFSRPVFDSKNNVIEQVGEGNRKDIRNAVEVARNAQGAWGKRAAFDRSQICFYIAENLMARSAEFAQRIHIQTGKPLEACEKEVAVSISRLFFYAAYADKYGGSVQETTLYGLTVRIHEPLGVVGVACPDDYPLLGFISLFAPLVVRGNSIVIIPSSKHPLCATDLYQVFDTSDLPAGVVNIVTGDRDLLTKTLVEHQEIDGMWYYGTAEGSRNVEFGSSDNMKRSFVNYGYNRNWESNLEGQGIEFLREAVQCKNIWVPMGF